MPGCASWNGKSVSSAMKADFLSKAAAYFASGASVSDKYEFIDAEIRHRRHGYGCRSHGHAHVRMAPEFLNQGSTNGGHGRKVLPRSGGKC